MKNLNLLIHQINYLQHKQHWLPLREQQSSSFHPIQICIQVHLWDGQEEVRKMVTTLV